MATCSYISNNLSSTKCRPISSGVLPQFQTHGEWNCLSLHLLVLTIPLRGITCCVVIVVISHINPSLSISSDIFSLCFGWLFASNLPLTWLAQPTRVTSVPSFSTSACVEGDPPTMARFLFLGGVLHHQQAPIRVIRSCESSIIGGFTALGSTGNHGVNS